MKRTAILVLLPVMAACAAATSGSSALFDTAWSPPSGQSCSESTRPEAIPRVEAVLDVAGFRALAERVGEMPPALLSVSFDTAGAAGSVRMVAPREGGAELESLRDAVERSLRPQRPGRGWGVLLKVEPGVSGLRLGRFEECPPQLQNRQYVARVMERGMNEAVRARIVGSPPRPVVMRLRIDTLGVVTEVQPQTFTQIRTLDSLAVNVAREMRFHPARLNREPVPVWLQIPVQFAVEQEARETPVFPPRSRPRP